MASSSVNITLLNRHTTIPNKHPMFAYNDTQDGNAITTRPVVNEGQIRTDMTLGWNANRDVI